MGDWRSLHVGLEDDGLIIGGVEVWRREWRQSDDAVADVPDPLYPEQSRHRFPVYEIEAADRKVRFAAGELSNGVWGFFVDD